MGEGFSYPAAWTARSRGSGREASCQFRMGSRDGASAAAAAFALAIVEAAAAAAEAGAADAEADAEAPAPPPLPPIHPAPLYAMLKSSRKIRQSRSVISSRGLRDQ